VLENAEVGSVSDTIWRVSMADGETRAITWVASYGGWDETEWPEETFKL